MKDAGSRIYIVDRDTRRREKIVSGLSAGNFEAALFENLEDLPDFPPDDGLLLLNDDLAGDDIAYLTETITARTAHVPVALFGEHPSTGNIVQAILAGAVDYLEWPFDAARLDETIAKAETEASAQLKLLERQREARAKVEGLSARERDVLSHLIRGWSNKDIAKLLDISPRTVEVHRANMLEKLNARSSSEAVRIGIYAGLDD